MAIAVIHHRVPVVGGLSPWGVIRSVRVDVPDQIVFVSTDSHGGTWLRPDLHEALQKETPFETFTRSNWYEEDCDAAAVVVFFPQHYSESKIDRACRFVIGGIEGYYTKPLVLRAIRWLVENHESELTSESARAIIKRHLGQACKVDGERAYIRGFATEYAIICPDIRPMRQYEWAWPTVLRVLVTRNGEFRS